MTRFIKKIILFFSISITLLFLFDLMITKGLKKSSYEDFYEWNEIFEGNIHADIIINGSSKALRQFSPGIIDSVTNLSCYNLGIMGHNYFLQEAKYNVYIKNNKYPKIFVQVVSTGTFEKREDLFNFKQFLPYLDDSLIYNATKSYEGLSFFDKKIPFIKYTKASEIIIEGVLSFLIYPLLLKLKLGIKVTLLNLNPGTIVLPILK